MQSSLRFLFFSFFISILLHSNQQKAFADDFSVGVENQYLSVSYDNSYLDVVFWYPTFANTRYRKIGLEGKSYNVALNARPLSIFENQLIVDEISDKEKKEIEIIESEQVPQKLPLLIISAPSYANSQTYATLAHAFAKKGYLVASIIHVGDWQHDMRYTFTAIQNPLRALHLKIVGEYFLAQKKFNIDEENISSISFQETALAPLMTYGAAWSEENYTNFCEQFSEDKLCKSPLKQQIENIYEDVEYYDAAIEEAKEFYLIESERVKKENEVLEKAWQLAVEKAEKMSEPLPPEPEWLALPKEVKEIDAYFPFIKNFIFIEPNFTFLFDFQEHNDFDEQSLNIHSFSLENKEKNNAEEFLTQIYSSRVKEHSFTGEDFLLLTDRCTNAEKNDYSIVCARIDEENHAEIINSFVEKIDSVLR